MRIQIIKELPRCSVGQRINVEQNQRGKYISRPSASRGALIYYLDEIEHYCEMIKYEPKLGDEYETITSLGEIEIVTWTNSPIDNRRFIIGNCYELGTNAEEALKRVVNAF